MADFCLECGKDYFGEDTGDLVGLCKEGEVIAVLCEGCGHCWVNHLGKCVTKDCYKQHGIRGISEDPTTEPRSGLH